jgi:tetratricopeptide (TPR) repeat protein
VARGAAKARPKRPKPDARRRTPSSGGASSKSIEQQLFFTRLRKTQKPIFIFLALVFAVGFVFFGVGSGSTGIADVLGNFSSFFGGGTKTSSAVSSAQKDVKKHPNSAAAWKDLANALQTDGKDAEAAKALERYVRLRPKDDAALLQLGTYYTTHANDIATRWQAAAGEASTQSAFFQPAGLPANDGLAKAFAQDPIGQVFQQRAEKLRQDTLKAFVKAKGAFSRLVKLKPTDQFTQFQLADASRALYLLGGTPKDRTDAIAALRRGIKLDPKSPEAARAQQALTQLLVQFAPSSGG